MQCDEGCRECCSECVPVSDAEMARVLFYANEHDLVPSEDPAMCPWYQGGRCSVYEARPIVCRIFGHTDDAAMQCDRGYNANVTPERKKELLRAMQDKGAPVRFLHEIQKTTDWQARVAVSVWEHVQKERQKAGLAPLGEKDAAE
jgi:Fe-S-cluster containining protein